MADAEVGDEQKMEDPTVNRLRDRVCELLGKEDAVFLPSGTMGNQIAIRVHCRLGDEVIADRTAHIINADFAGDLTSDFPSVTTEQDWTQAQCPQVSHCLRRRESSRKPAVPIAIQR